MNAAKKLPEEFAPNISATLAADAKPPHTRRRRTNAPGDTPPSDFEAPASAALGNPTLVSRAALTKILRNAGDIRVYSMFLGRTVKAVRSDLYTMVSCAPEDAQFIQPNVEFVDGVGFVVIFQ